MEGLVIAIGDKSWWWNDAAMRWVEQQPVSDSAPQQEERRPVTYAELEQQAKEELWQWVAGPRQPALGAQDLLSIIYCVREAQKTSA